MPYSNIVERTDAQALMPEDIQREIIKNVPQMSAVMSVSRRLPNMSRKQRRIPVLSQLIDAYFVNGDTGLKQTDETAWQNKFIDAEELAVIVPIPINVLEDADYDLWGEVRPQIEEAFGKAFDRAVLYGENAPGVWPDDLLTAATAAGHAVTVGAGLDLFDDIMAENGVIAKVEEDAFAVNGHLSSLTMRAKLRGLRDANGQPIFVQSMQQGGGYLLDGAPAIFPTNGSFRSGDPALMFSGDWSQLVYAIRSDVSYSIADQGVITDAGGNIVFNLFQQDMVALRAVMRVGWQVPNPINRVNETEATRYPFSVLLP